MILSQCHFGVFCRRLVKVGFAGGKLPSTEISQKRRCEGPGAFFLFYPTVKELINHQSSQHVKKKNKNNKEGSCSCALASSLLPTLQVPQAPCCPPHTPSGKAQGVLPVPLKDSYGL